MYQEKREISTSMTGNLELVLWKHTLMTRHAPVVIVRRRGYLRLSASAVGGIGVAWETECEST